MNVILLIIDALRYDHVNSENTPNLVKLANRGVFFTNAFSCNSSTIVSMPCILCGQKSYNPQKNIATLLSHSGLHTTLIHSNPIIHGFYPGFNETIDLKSKQIRMDKRLKKLIRKSLPSNIVAGMKKFRATMYEDDKYLPYARAQDTLEFTSKWMKENNNYFLWVHLMEPHIPYYPLNTMLKITRHEMRTLNDKLIESVHGNYYPTDEEVEQARVLYSEDIKEMDEQLEKFFESLNEDDLLVITSDHGEEFGENGQFSHHENKMIPELLHVPLIFFGKQVKEGLILENQVSTNSIGQTVLDSLHIEVQLGESSSLWNMLKI